MVDFCPRRKVLGSEATAAGTLRNVTKAEICMQGDALSEPWHCCRRRDQHGLPPARCLSRMCMTEVCARCRPFGLKRWLISRLSRLGRAEPVESGPQAALGLGGGKAARSHSAAEKSQHWCELRAAPAEAADVTARCRRRARHGCDRAVGLDGVPGQAYSLGKGWTVEESKQCTVPLATRAEVVANFHITP